ncbi:putative bifunctional diguanylate cyclase/phosphodiesterase [Pseudarthrobacter sp. YS3]|uniref:putative bifunctional diguanylate cyclase/phosphodiesterase n=1 Tax=Pseudarthrobacter sp. YS3 TaxID=3453718 RepID=UPI003EEDE79F
MTLGDHLRIAGDNLTRNGIDAGQGRVIYPDAQTPAGTGAIIRYGTLADFAAGQEATVQAHGQAYSREAAVRRAKRAIGHRLDEQDSGGAGFVRGCLFDTRPERTRQNHAPSDGDGRTLPVPAPAVKAPDGRKRSLRREWTVAFVLMLAALLIGAAVTIIGVRTLMNDVQTTTTRLHQDADRLLELRSALDAHQQAGLRLLTGARTDTSAFLEQQASVSDMFDDLAAVLPPGQETAADLRKTRDAWQESLQAHDLWDSQVQQRRAIPEGGPAEFADSSAGVRALLAVTQRSTLKKMDEGLTDAAGLEQLLISVRAAYFGLALATTAYFGRRMLNDLMKPIRELRQGALKLQSGDYNHRIRIARHDELGELAESFNAMAASVQDSHAALTYRAGHDTLTGLPNRAVLTETLTHTLGQNADTLALLFIDIDNFKAVNDSLGHAGGDELLAQLATRLTGCVRSHDLAARLGGDEFAIIVLDEDGETSRETAERIHDALQSPFFIRNNKATVSVSMGVAQGHRGGTDAQELLRQADFAMYVAKHGGKARYQLFDADDYDRMAHRAALKAGIAAAAADGQLRLDYQPVIDLQTNAIVGLEALVRWQHPSLGLLKPKDFIPIAEETGEIAAIGSWVLETAARQASNWRATFSEFSSLWVSVNLSAHQLSSHRSLLVLKDILTDKASEADKVILEITETALASDIDGGIAALCMLKESGARIAIDDFGTGFSSLSTLATLPADILKIDRSFLTHAGHPSTAILEGIVGLAHKLGLDVIAEGIEEPGQLQTLQNLGCQMGQGYLLGGPAPAQAIEARLLKSIGAGFLDRTP